MSAMADHAHAGHGHAHVDTSGDKRAAFTGLIAGVVLLGALVYGTVAWTNSHYAHEGGERAGAEATK